MLSRQRAETVARWAIVLHAVFAGVTFALARWNGSVSNMVLAWLIAAGVPFWLLPLLHLRGQRLAEQEEADWQRLLAERKAGGGKGALFEVEEGEAFQMRNRLRALERVWLPVGSVLLVVVFGSLAFLFTRDLLHVRLNMAVESALLSAGFLSVEAFMCFVIGMYACGMAKEAVWRPIRAGASYLMFCAAGLLFVVIALLAGKYDLPRVDLYFAWALTILSGLLALEILLNFVINIYRPRTRGVEVRYAHDSRILELITSPGAILHTAAATLDYQFGFKVSETWFYRFLERAIAPILLFWLVTFYLLTTLIVVGPEEKVIIERFGKYTNGGRILGPGIHLKWPWPVEVGYRFPTVRVRTLTVGFAGEDPNAQKLWTVQHYAVEYKLLVATAPEAGMVVKPEAGTEAAPPVNLIVCNLVVHYRIKDDDKALRDYAYRVRDADKLLETIAYREMTRYMASADFYRVMCQDREAAGAELTKRIQDAADVAAEGRQLGMEVVFVGVEGVHPPVEEGVGGSFEDVVASQQDKRTMVLSAEAAALQKVIQARYDAKVNIRDASAYRFSRSVASEAEAARFEKRLEAYRAAPGVYEVREFLDNIEEALRGPRKYIVAAKGWNTEVIRLNLQESLPGLLDLPAIGQKQDSEKKESGKP